MDKMFNKKHVVSMRDLTREDVEFILDCAERMMPYAKIGRAGAPKPNIGVTFF